MKRALAYVVTLTPKQVLLRVWALLLVAMVMSGIRPLSGLASALGIVVIVGYSYLVILGATSSSARLKRVARTLCAFLIAFAVGVTAALPFLEARNMEAEAPGSVQDWVGLAIVGPVNIAIFAPFFLATHVINEARRAKGVQKPFDGFLTFISLYFGLFGGLIYAHRLVREFFGEGIS